MMPPAIVLVPTTARFRQSRNGYQIPSSCRSIRKRLGDRVSSARAKDSISHCVNNGRYQVSRVNLGWILVRLRSLELRFPLGLGMVVECPTFDARRS